jgi:hypothetical protein
MLSVTKDYYAGCHYAKSRDIDLMIMPSFLQNFQTFNPIHDESSPTCLSLSLYDRHIDCNSYIITFHCANLIKHLFASIDFQKYAFYDECHK